MGFWKGLGTACLVLTMGFCAFIGYAERETIKETWNEIFNQEQQVNAESKINANLSINYFDEENKIQELMQVKKSADVNLKDNLYSVVAQISLDEINQKFNQPNLILSFDTSNVTVEEDYSVISEIKTDEQTQEPYFEFIVSSNKEFVTEVNITLTLQTIVIQEIKMPYTVSAYYSTYVDEFILPATAEDYSLPKKSAEYINLEVEDPNGASFTLYNANGLFSEQFIVFNMTVPENFAETDYIYQTIGVDHSENFDITQMSVENNFIYIEISPNETATSWEEFQLFEIDLFYGKQINE